MDVQRDRAVGALLDMYVGLRAEAGWRDLEMALGLDSGLVRRRRMPRIYRMGGL